MTPHPGSDNAQRRAELEHNLASVRARISAACAAADRSDDEPRLVVVTKFHPVEDMRLLAELGVREMGENRVQEAQAKAQAWEDMTAAEPQLQRPRLAMIGHIQSKKTGAVARWADEVQSVDSVKVAAGLARGRAREIEQHGATPLSCLVQLSMDADTARGGVPVDDVLSVADEVAAADSLVLSGVMVVPPLNGEPAAHFQGAAESWAALRETYPEATEFSAGMSGDLEAAIAAGSTCVRVGTAILGPRPIP